VRTKAGKRHPDDGENASVLSRLMTCHILYTVGGNSERKEDIQHPRTLSQFYETKKIEK
jgi:hypothetical protein